MNILLVSTGPTVTRQVTTGLPSEDVDLTEVRTPQRAVALIDEGAGPYDIVIGDADTHPTGGFYLAREIKARVAGGKEMPPVVLLIARPQDEYLSRWSEADAWLIKPIDPFDLSEVIEALVGRRPVPALPGVGVLGEVGRLGPGGEGERQRAGGRGPGSDTVGADSGLPPGTAAGTAQER